MWSPEGKVSMNVLTTSPLTPTGRGPSWVKGLALFSGKSLLIGVDEFGDEEGETLFLLSSVSVWRIH